MEKQVNKKPRTKDGILIGKNLRCGCCGTGFSVWENYISQDQDLGYGTCRSCQGEAEERNIEQLDEMAMQIENALSEPNKTKFKNKSQEERHLFVYKALDDGMFTWSIGK